MKEVKVNVTFTPERTGCTKGLLLVSRGDDVLHSDRIDIAKAKYRTAFLNKVKKLYPNIDVEPLSKRLLQEVKRASEQDAEPEQGRMILWTFWFFKLVQRVCMPNT